MNLVPGVDVSVFEPRVDWRSLREQGYKFALIRATSGIGYVDPKFAAHWSGARGVGILRGAYHYLFGGQDAKRQGQTCSLPPSEMIKANCRPLWIWKTPIMKIFPTAN